VENLDTSQEIATQEVNQDRILDNVTNVVNVVICKEIALMQVDLIIRRNATHVEKQDISPENALTRKTVVVLPAIKLVTIVVRLAIFLVSALKARKRVALVVVASEAGVVVATEEFRHATNVTSQDILPGSVTKWKKCATGATRQDTSSGTAQRMKSSHNLHRCAIPATNQVM
jgi:hypothetical protein